MPFSNVPSDRSRVAQARSTGLGPPPRVAQPAPTDVSGLWRGVMAGLAITAAALALGWLAGCTIEKITLYEYATYPAPATTASGVVYPQARTP